MKRGKKVWKYWECKKCGTEIKMAANQKPMKGIKCPCGGNYIIKPTTYGEHN